MQMRNAAAVTYLLNSVNKREQQTCPSRRATESILGTSTALPHSQMRAQLSIRLHLPRDPHLEDDLPRVVRVVSNLHLDRLCVEPKPGTSLGYITYRVRQFVKFFPVDWTHLRGRLPAPGR